MQEVIDKKYNIVNTRFNYCFQCQPNLEEDPGEFLFSDKIKRTIDDFNLDEWLLTEEMENMNNDN